MRKVVAIFFIVLGLNSVLAQLDKNIYELDSMQNLLTRDVKDVIDNNLTDKKVVFLGEAQHSFGSDFLAKTEFVKYLVLEKGYKNIAFESDFFALYFNHNKSDLFYFWSGSIQCKALFEFLKEHNVTIWGFDNQLYSIYTQNNFAIKLEEFLKTNVIDFDENFIKTTEIYIKNRKKANKVVGKDNLAYLLREVERLLKDNKVIEDKLWFQFLESYKSDILINSTHKSNNKGIPIRDRQMARNLDFLIKTNPEKKFIVWLANAHMAKHEYKFMKGQTMGSQFVNLNPDISYHIAVSSVFAQWRKPKWLEKMSKDENNLLHFLPSIDKNYFIDSKQLISDNPEYKDKEYVGMFNLNKHKTNWFKHFDALVFISKGEAVAYPERKLE